MGKVLPLSQQETHARQTVNAAIAQPDVQPGYPDALGNTDTSWCNRATDRIVNSLGGSLDPVLSKNPTTGRPDINYSSANAIGLNAAAAAAAGEITEVAPEKAQTLANNGILVIATLIVPGGHGHVGFVVGSSSPYNPKDGPLIGQAGSSNGIFYASSSQAFGDSASSVKYYALTPNPAIQRRLAP